MRPGTLTLALLLPVFLLGAAPPVVDQPVVDPEARLSAADREAVATELGRLRWETGAQMAVLVVGTTDGESIEDYALRAAEAWRGGEAGRDNGLLYVLAVEDRRQRLEVGYGLEEHLPDSTARTLLEAQGPLLRQGDLRGAVLAVVSGVRVRLQDTEGRGGFQEPWDAAAVQLAFLCVLGGGLVAGVLLGLCVGLWRQRLGEVRLAGVAGALVAGPVALVTASVQGGPLGTSDFQLALLVFITVFFLATLAYIKSWIRLSLAMAGGTLLGGWIAGQGNTTDVFELLITTGITAAFITFVVFVPGKGSGSRTYGTSSRSGSSSSRSSSSSSWGGGGGSFGGGGASSSW